MKLLVFCGENYIEHRPSETYQGSFETIEDVNSYLLMKRWDWAEVIDSETKKLIVTYSRN